MAKYEVIGRGLYGINGEVPVGTVVNLNDDPPEGMSAKLRKVSAKVAQPDDCAENAESDGAEIRHPERAGSPVNTKRPPPSKG